MPLPATNLVIICSGIFGLLWGSFVLVCADRLNKPKTIINGRSTCPKCSKQIRIWDLVPVLSFFLLRGRCRNCKKPIGFIYPIVEIFFMAFFALYVWRFGLSVSSIPLILSVSLLAVGSVIDIRDREVDLWIFLVGIFLAVVWSLIYRGLDGTSIKLMLISIVIASFLPFVFAVFSSQKWMGYGDIFFAVWAGVICGYPAVLVAIFSAFLLGSIFGIIQVGQGRAKMKSAISFGPFLAIGSMVGLYFGQDIFNLYLKLFGL